MDDGHTLVFDQPWMVSIPRIVTIPKMVFQRQPFDKISSDRYIGKVSVKSVNICYNSGSFEVAKLLRVLKTELGQT